MNGGGFRFLLPSRFALENLVHGVRCRLIGGLTIESLDTTHRFGPLQAWFELGPDPVLARADSEGSSECARVMLLRAHTRSSTRTQ